MSNKDDFDRLYDQLEKLNDRLESIQQNQEDRLNSIDMTLAKQEVSLGEHIRRTSLLEKELAKVRTELKPLQKHQDQIIGVIKFLGISALVLGVITKVRSLLGL